MPSFYLKKNLLELTKHKGHFVINFEDCYYKLLKLIHGVISSQRKCHHFFQFSLHP